LPNPIRNPPADCGTDGKRDYTNHA